MYICGFLQGFEQGIWPNGRCSEKNAATNGCGVFIFSLEEG
jgi:hypothetical protein